MSKTQRKTKTKYITHVNLCASCFATLDNRVRSGVEPIVKGHVGSECVGSTCHNLDCESMEAAYRVRLAVQEVER